MSELARPSAPLADDPVAPLRACVSSGVLDVRLAAHLTLLVDGGVPLVVAGETPLRTEIVAALALASPVPRGAGRGAEVFVVPNDAFTWLADPAGVGCVVPGAGSAPRSPRETRLRAAGLGDALDPMTTRSLIRALARGFPLLAEMSGSDLASLIARLRAAPFRVPEADLSRLGVVAFLDGARVGAAHFLRPVTTPDAARQAPAILGVWDGTRAEWDDFAWAAIPELAERCGATHIAYAAQLNERIQLLG